MQKYASALLFLSFLVLTLPLTAEDTELKDAWSVLGEDHARGIEIFAGEYMEFLAASPTEERAVQASKARALSRGFREVDRYTAVQGSRPFLVSNRGRALILVRPGRRRIEEGLRVIATHIDAPRLELKARPVYESQEFVLWQTVPHGGIKYYQWANIPLALVGMVHKTDGSRVEVEIGMDPSDPVFLIADLAPHVDRPRRSRTSREVVKGEELDPLAGSLPPDGVHETRKARILGLLSERYGIEEEDFVSAELRVVPALRPREVGLDRGLLAGYGQDDRGCSYAALRAVMDARRPEYWSVVYLADNEESGSNNNTGARTLFFQTMVGTWLEAEGRYSELAVRRTLARSIVASADVTTGINPMDPGVQEAGNASRLNGGVVIKRYGRGTDPNAEILAHVRRILEEQGLPWQTHTYKVDVGGGGTLGGFLSVLDMEVFDVGIPLLSMHSPYEVSSKADMYALYLFLKAFLEDEEAPRQS